MIEHFIFNVRPFTTDYQYLLFKKNRQRVEIVVFHPNGQIRIGSELKVKSETHKKNDYFFLSDQDPDRYCCPSPMSENVDPAPELGTLKKGFGIHSPYSSSIPKAK